MNDIQSQIELKVIGAQVSDWCKNREGIIFRSSLCTQERCIRFTTPLMQSIFPETDAVNSAWKSGVYFMYEIYNGVDEFKITASVSAQGLPRKQKKECLELLHSCGIEVEDKKELYFIKEWKYADAAKNLSKIMDAINDFSEVEMPYFEAELTKWSEDHSYVMKSFPNVMFDTLDREQLPEELLIEGGMKDILTNKYERNLTARKRCIAAHGTACNICGFDFGVVYGPMFAGKIEVHHKKPLYEIKEDYVVDPVEDLIPVCPNCHMVLHSKPDGFYTVEEVKEMLGLVIKK